MLRKPLENCLRAVRHGPHFVQSTKPQFSEVSAFRKGRRCTATENRRTTCEKARFPACGKCRPRRTAGKRFFRCPDSIRTPGLMPLPFPRFFEKNRVKLLIFRKFLGNLKRQRRFLCFRETCFSTISRLRITPGVFYCFFLSSGTGSGRTLAFRSARRMK